MTTTHELDDGVQEISGKKYMTGADGRLTPLDLVKPADKLSDETVRKVMGFALDLSAQIERFKAHTMDDLAGLDGLLEQQYGVVKAGNRGKGNRTYLSYDGCLKVTVQVADFVDFGPELQIAKQLIDECLNEWAADSRPEIRAIVTRAFNTDREGQINRAEIFMLLRLDIEDERWQRAMTAIRDAMRVVGRKEYVRFAMRDDAKAAWRTVTIDMAKA
ncbi:MAG: DUF3164 family protein [Nitratireductor sp.]|nr:DUF3164 family protein [Nitratireductor sp.]